MKFDLSTLGEHQEEGLHACIEGFDKHDRVQAHMACGTGKTRLGLAVAYELESRITLLLFPSLPLISQTLDTWITEGNLRHQDILCVCSDRSVGDQDEIDDVVDIPIEVTTSPDQVGRFFENRSFDAPAYIFCTYHSLPSLAMGLPMGLIIDLCIFDEAHRVVGDVDKSFSFGLNNHVDLRIEKRLFLTATPRLILTEEGEEDQVYSMSNEEVFGPVVYELSLHEAIERGIICDYQIVVSIQDSSLVDQYLLNTFDHDLIFKAASLLQTMDNVNAHKAFTFHQRISYSKIFSEALKLVAGHKGKPLEAWHVDGAMPEGERHGILKRFAESDTAVVSCSRCLSEGTNVPVTDLVAFMDPRSSETDIIQTLGRALRKAPGKTMGYVLIPLRLTEGESVEQMLESSSMRHIWRVLASLAEMDTKYISQLRTIRRDVPQKDWSNERIEVLEKVVIQATADVTEQAYRSIRFKMIDRLTSRWDSSFGELIRFGHNFGHLRVPKRYISASGFRLGAWCVTQRSLARTGMLNHERKAELAKAGFEFEPAQRSWDEAFREVLNYKEMFGTANVPLSHVTPEGFALGYWCSDQRKSKKANKMTVERENALRNAGFSFSPAEEAWMEKFNKLKSLVQDLGSIEKALAQDGELRVWITNQRNRRIPEERARLLKSIGVNLKSRFDNAWDKAFDLLMDYLEKNDGKHPPLSFRTEDGFALGNWVSNQRQAYASSKMSEERISRLKSINFIFNAETAAFEKGLSEIKIYKNKFGNSNVPNNYISPSGYKLGLWIRTTRHRMLAAPDKERIEALEKAGLEIINTK